MKGGPRSVMFISVTRVVSSSHSISPPPSPSLHSSHVQCCSCRRCVVVTDVYSSVRVCDARRECARGEERRGESESWPHIAERFLINMSINQRTDTEQDEARIQLDDINAPLDPKPTAAKVSNNTLGHTQRSQSDCERALTQFHLLFCSVLDFRRSI